MTDNYRERVCDGYDHLLAIDELLVDIHTAHQHLVIFKNRSFGRVLALDGVIQTTEGDEFIYHEMMAHVPILAHGSVRRVLIIGGGDGALLREVLRHRNIEQVIQVEIDRSVIELCRQYLPTHSSGAFDDPRVQIVIDEGLHYLRHTDAHFDVILTDSTDPDGPARILFSEACHAACKDRLTPGGVLVTQNGVAFLQLETVRSSAGIFDTLFKDWHFFSAAIPTYAGGSMAFGWGSDNPQLRQTDAGTLRQRFARSGISTRYYTPDIHRSAFALPRYILEAIGKPVT